MVWILELLHFLANTTLTLGLKTQLTFGGINFLAFFHYSKTLVFEGKKKLKPPNEPVDPQNLSRTWDLSMDG